MRESCKDCKFVYPARDGLGRPSELQCRREPPKVLVMMAPDRKTIEPQTCLAPSVPADWWCGEFKAALIHIASGDQN